jgi:hypothetical protein
VQQAVERVLHPFVHATATVHAAQRAAQQPRGRERHQQEDHEADDRRHRDGRAAHHEQRLVEAGADLVQRQAALHRIGSGYRW